MKFAALVALVCGLHTTEVLPQQIEFAAVSAGVPAELVLAQISVESKCDPHAVGTDGDTGLMQIIPRFHRARINEYGVQDLTQPLGNLVVGTSLLADLKTGHNYRTALARYNGGSTPPARSYRYADKVLTKYEEYLDLPAPETPKIQAVPETDSGLTRGWILIPFILGVLGLSKSRK